MKAAFAQMASIIIVLFAVSSMLSVGLAYPVGSILRPLRKIRAVFRALVANFVLVPLLAVGIERLIPLEPPLAVGLFLLAGSAGAPFLIKLTSAAGDDLALSAALLLLLVPATVLFLPFYVPLAMSYPTLRDLSYVPSSPLSIGVPLLSTLVVPILVGLAVRELAPRWAERLAPIGSKVATITLVLSVVAIFGAYFQELMRIVKTPAVVAGAMLIVGAFAVGFLLSRRDRSTVLGLGTAQRNIAAAMVIASRDFTNPDVLVMITASCLVGLAILFPLSWLLSRQAPHVGLPTSKAATT